MSYTVMGDGVNIAARLEGINKEFRTRICISHGVFKEAGERLCVRPIDEVTVKGRRGLKSRSTSCWAPTAPTIRSSSRARRRCGCAELTRLRTRRCSRRTTPGACGAIAQMLCEFPDDPVASRSGQTACTVGLPARHGDWNAAWRY